MKYQHVYAVLTAEKTATIQPIDGSYAAQTVSIQNQLLHIQTVQNTTC